MMGPRKITTHRTGRDMKRATSSGFMMARVLGRTSAKTRTKSVIRPVEIAAPHGPGMAFSIDTVATADAPMFRTFCSSRMAPIIFS